MGADQKQTCVTPAHKWQRTSILLTASAQRRKTSFSSFTPPLQSYSSSPLSSTLLMGPLCHLLVYSVLSRYPPGSLLLFYLVRNSALCVVCVRPLSGLLYCKKELMCNWRPKVWTSEEAVTSVCYCCGWVQHFTTTENHLQHGWTIGSGRSHYSTSQVSRPYGNSAFAPSHREDKGRLWEKMGVKLPVVEELSVGVRGLFQLLSISRRKHIKKCESKIDIKESFQQQHIYYIYYIHTPSSWSSWVTHCRATAEPSHLWSALHSFHSTGSDKLSNTHSHWGSCEAGTAVYRANMYTMLMHHTACRRAEKGRFWNSIFRFVHKL